MHARQGFKVNFNPSPSIHPLIQRREASGDTFCTTVLISIGDSSVLSQETLPFVFKRETLRRDPAPMLQLVSWFYIFCVPKVLCPKRTKDLSKLRARIWWPCVDCFPETQLKSKGKSQVKSSKDLWPSSYLCSFIPLLSCFPLQRELEPLDWEWTWILLLFSCFRPGIWSQQWGRKSRYMVSLIWVTFWIRHRVTEFSVSMDGIKCENVEQIRELKIKSKHHILAEL